jgi:hypothetical protein
MSKFEIWINNYYHMHGGNRALHVLRDELLVRDVEAWMAYERHDPDAVAVYPEITGDNPGNHDKVTRWLLNTPTQPLPSDPAWAWEKNMGEDKLLTVNIIEFDLFRPSSNSRSGTAYWVGKGVKDESVIPTGSIEITRGNYTTRKEIAELLSSINYLISFDPFTAMNLEAVLCGTPVLVQGHHPVMSRQQIIDHGWTPFGVAWDMEELDEARAQVHLAWDHYRSMIPVFNRRVDEFVEKTTRLFG